MDSSKTAPPGDAPKIISAASCRMSARLFTLGNIIALLPGLTVAPVMMLGGPSELSKIFMFILMVVPPILWFGISIVIYIIARYHPNPRVGYYTQWAAYRFYGMLGVVIPVGTFYGNAWQLWIITGGVVALVLVPWSLWDLYRIHREEWHETVINEEDAV